MTFHPDARCRDDAADAVNTSLDHATTGDGAACAGCERLDRRAFLSTASMLSIGALLAACGDGDVSGPGTVLQVTDPLRIDFSAFPALSQVGGRVVITPSGRAPMLVERIATRQYRAFSLVCPHNGTVVHQDGSGFLCPNHLARFNAEGTWIGGTSTADLPPIGITEVVSGGQPVALMVGGVVVPPVLAASSTAVSFSAVVGGTAPSAQTVNITNAGGSVLTGITLDLTYAANQPTGWLTASLSASTAPATLTLGVSRGTLAAGTYTANVQLAATAVGAAPKSISVTLLVIDSNAPATLQLSAATANFSTTIGSSPAAQTVQVSNGGGGTIGALAWSVAYGAGATGWLSTSALSLTSTPSVLTLRPVVTGLAVGTYSATVTVSGAGVASRTLAVTLTVIATGLAVTIAAWPALANVGGVAGSVGTLNGQPIAVVRTGQASFAAFSLRCPHQGTTVQVVNSATFRCPNHGATWGASGALQSNSPFRTSALAARTVTYQAGDTTLYVN